MSIPVIAAPPAMAETAVLAPKDGAVITSGTQLTATADADFRAAKVELRVSGPGGDTLLDEQTFAAGELTGTFPITQNGSYKVYLGHFSGELAASEFTVKVPPATPAGLSANVSGEKLVVKWAMGEEAGLEGYTLTGTGVKPSSGSVGAFCSGSKCAASLPLTQESGTFSVEVRAKRSDGVGGSVYSDAATASDVVTAANVPSAGGGSTSLPVTGGSASSTAPLTPFNEQSPITLPSVQPDGATPGLVYPAPEIAQDAPVAQNIAATDRLQWGKSVGIALVLLVVAAHLGTWTRSLRVASVATSSRGRAARIARGGTGRKRVTKAREHIARAEAVAKTGPVKPKTDAAKAESAKAESAKGGAAKGGAAKGGAAKGGPATDGPAKGSEKAAPAQGASAKTVTMPKSAAAPKGAAPRAGAGRAPSRKGADAKGRRRPAGVEVTVARSRRK
ncbi:hypothetical protein [Actinomadura algeriensis]|uniref:Fibronectin type-III domain-containing protein n=1 Tax=Actinomadura algeriensis TaxID=1679523 RepID=A0ABR9JNS2_9ACTN|nr:hypothetical protein [Actinomadura algeriensis]MBE1532226.1 hypothetical protein [Actinomadura algeriensis]